MLTACKNREILFQLLYGVEAGSGEIQDLFPLLMKYHKVSKKTLFGLQEQLVPLRLHLPQIDRLIEEHVIGYRFDRILDVEKNVLRLAVYELCVHTGTPPKVVLSEAIRLARKFGTTQSGDFVNGVLDALYKKGLG